MHNNQRCIDLSHVLLADHDILATQTRATMAHLARARGYALADVRRACNRFNRFWVLGQWIEYGQSLRLACETSGETVVIALTRKHEDA